MKAKQVPPAWAAAHKRSARRLLLTEARSAIRLRTAARQVHHELLGQLQTTGGQAAALVALKAARERMAATVAAQIVETRRKARLAALETVNDELNLLSKQLSAMGFKSVAFGKPVLGPQENPEDVASADAVSHSLAAHWAQTVLALLVAMGSDADVTIEVRARTVMQRLDHRIVRIATTESARAYSGQHDDTVENLLEPHHEAKWVMAVFHYWSALLDRSVCTECRAHDGDIRPIGLAFDGDTPGDMHPNCRCTDGLLLLPAKLESEEPDADEEFAAEHPEEDAAQ